jgi:RNA polymerase sigma-70 factor (ECF subfamily)
VAELGDAYRAARAADGATPQSDEEDGALEQRLAALCVRGHAAHPAVALDDAVFAAHLGRCGAAVGVAPAEIHAEDLFLCCAALLGDDGAIRTLRASARPVLAGYLHRIDPSPSFIDEVEQRLWDAALVGSAGAPAKLATYAGKGPLAGWLGVVAQRIGLTIRRQEASEQRAAEAAGSEADRVASDPELSFIKGHLRAPFRRAIVQALESLDDRERMVYRMHIVDGVSLERIGKTYGVAQSTVSRWMAGARDTIAAEAQRILREELHASADDYESMSRLLVSQLDLSVSRLFRNPA